MGSGLIVHAGGRLTLPESETSGGSGVWLLEMAVDGRAERFSTETVEVVDLAGDTLVFRSGLRGFTRSLWRGSDTQGIEVDDYATDWAALDAQGVEIERAECALWWWYPGMVLEAGICVMRGVAVGVEVGDPDGPTRLVFTLDQRARDRVTAWPPLQAAIDETTFTHDPPAGTQIIDDAVMGLPYPTVLGRPGSGDADVWSVPIAGTPGYAVAVDGTVATFRLLLSIGSVDASTVEVYDNTDPAFLGAYHETWNVTIEADDLGRAISVARPGGATALTLDKDREWLVGWSVAAGGGLLAPDGIAIRDLGDVLLWALDAAGLPIDREAQEGELAALAPYKIDACLRQATDLEGWIESQLVPVFPLRRIRTGRGLWYRHQNWHATESDVVARITVDAGESTASHQAGPPLRELGDAVASSPVRTLRGDVSNVFTIEYQDYPLLGRYIHRRILSATHQTLDVDYGLDERVIGSELCRISQARYGVLEQASVQCDVTWSDSTAALVLRDWAARDCAPLRGTTITLRHAEHLLAADPVLLVDVARSLSSRVCLVDDVVIGGPMASVDLVILPGWLRVIT